MDSVPEHNWPWNMEDGGVGKGSTLILFLPSPSRVVVPGDATILAGRAHIMPHSSSFLVKYVLHAIIEFGFVATYQLPIITTS